MPDEEVPASFYDGSDIAAVYSAHRHAGSTSPNEVMEEPAFLDAVGDVVGARIVDLGCGDASFGRTALAGGCRSYLGVDDSGAMLDRARTTLEGSAGVLRRSRVEALDLPAGSVDLVVSRLALHYVEDLQTVLSSCRGWLAPGGRLVLTVLHPVLTAPRDPAGTGEQRTDWRVDDYFSPGPRRREWMGSRVTWYHRTVEDHLDVLERAGFSLTALRECAPRPERFGPDASELARRRRVPLFLLLGARVR